MPITGALRTTETAPSVTASLPWAGAEGGASQPTRDSGPAGPLQNLGHPWAPCQQVTRPSLLPPSTRSPWNKPNSPAVTSGPQPACERGLGLQHVQQPRVPFFWEPLDDPEFLDSSFTFLKDTRLTPPSMVITPE